MLIEEKMWGEAKQVWIDATGHLNLNDSTGRGGWVRWSRTNLNDSTGRESNFLYINAALSPLISINLFFINWTPVAKRRASAACLIMKWERWLSSIPFGRDYLIIYVSSSHLQCRRSHHVFLKAQHNCLTTKKCLFCIAFCIVHDITLYRL